MARVHRRVQDSGARWPLLRAAGRRASRSLPLLSPTGCGGNPDPTPTGGRALARSHTRKGRRRWRCATAATPAWTQSASRWLCSACARTRSRGVALGGPGTSATGLLVRHPRAVPSPGPPDDEYIGAGDAACCLHAPRTIRFLTAGAFQRRAHDNCGCQSSEPLEARGRAERQYRDLIQSIRATPYGMLDRSRAAASRPGLRAFRPPWRSLGAAWLFALARMPDRRRIAVAVAAQRERVRRMPPSAALADRPPDAGARAPSVRGRARDRRLARRARVERLGCGHGPGRRRRPPFRCARRPARCPAARRRAGAPCATAPPASHPATAGAIGCARRRRRSGSARSRRGARGRHSVLPAAGVSSADPLAEPESGAPGAALRIRLRTTGGRASTHGGATMGAAAADGGGRSRPPARRAPLGPGPSSSPADADPARRRPPGRRPPRPACAQFASADGPLISAVPFEVTFGRRRRARPDRLVPPERAAALELRPAPRPGRPQA